MLVGKIVSETETGDPGLGTPTLMAEDCPLEGSQDEDYKAADAAGRDVVVEIGGYLKKRRRCLYDTENCFGPFGRDAACTACRGRTENRYYHSLRKCQALGDKSVGRDWWH